MSTSILIAKLKTDEDGIYYKVVTGKDAFIDDFEFDNARVYIDDYKLEPGEWFVVDDFSSKEYCIVLLKNKFNSISYSFIEKDDYECIDFVVSIKNNEYFMFQKITPSFICKHRFFISFSEQAKVLEGKDLLVLKEVPDCIYVASSDKLYFKKLSSITSIFNGINELYKEATDSEVENFLNLEIIKLNNNFGKYDVKQQNRRRIREANERFNSFTLEQKKGLNKYICKYCGDIFDKNLNKCIISNEKDLTNLLNCINQRYFTTEIEQEKTLAHSVSKVPNPL